MLRRAVHRAVGPPLSLLVFVVGTGSLGAEIAAVRLLAPYFGASTIVWANTIGVVLVALSVGYWLGGRLADRHPSMEALCLTSLVAAVMLAIVPFAADPLLGLAVDAIDEISAGAFLGSLLAVLVLVAVPVLLLGTVSPWAIRLGVRSVEEAGTVAGRLYALSTAGSLVGTLMSALVLIPLVGTRRTFLVFALAIAVVSVLGLRPLRRWALAPAAIVVLIALPVGTLKAKTEDGGRVIHEAETEYQYARVVEYPSGKRTLELNEGQAEHSVCEAECDAGPAGPRDPSSVLTGNYWDDLLVDFFAGGRPAQAPGGARRAATTFMPRRVAILGNAAGTTSRAYEEFFPRTRVDGVEIDPELSAIGRRYFDMNNPRLHLYHEDARPFMRRIDARYDVVSVDAYRQPYIPFYLTTKEFFESVRDRLARGGVLLMNVGHPEGEDGLEKVLSATVGQVFAHVLRDPIKDTNTVLIASDAPLSAARMNRVEPALPPALRPTAEAAAQRLARPLRGGDVYTDDKAPVEWLVDKSIIDYASGE
jgi:predicted membrane-bound spermidine synthase